MNNEARFQVVAFVASLLFSALFSAAAVAEDKVVELTFSHWSQDWRALHKVAVAWAESVEKDSNGSIKVKVYPEFKLGKPVDHYDMARTGKVDVAFIVTGYYQPKAMLVSGAILLPFLVDNAESGSRAFDEWYRPYAVKDMPGVKLCTAFVHDPGTLHSKTKITRPDQLAGLKIRPATAVVGEWMKLLGATPVNFASTEANKAMTTGGADAITFPFGLVYSYQVDKVATFSINAPMYTSAQAWIINQAKYDSLSPAQKRVIDNHCNSDWAYRIGKEWAEEERAGFARMKTEPNHTITRLTPLELAMWKRSAQPLVGAWSDQVRAQGYNPEKILNDLNRTLLKYRSKM